MYEHFSNYVAPLAGAWIEIVTGRKLWFNCNVAPLAGAWIEMTPIFCMFGETLSLPLRERGLKFARQLLPARMCFVAPLAGAWIEI